MNPFIDRRMARRVEFKEVFYTDKKWRILERKRRKAIEIMACLRRERLRSVVHGSVARGDVSERSDVDVFIPFKVSSYQVELALEKGNFKIFDRLIIQATPSYCIKAYIALDLEGLLSVSFPLVKLRRRELDFYMFGGCIGLNGLKEGVRVPGVNKRLMLIEPTNLGHIESPVIGREVEVAEVLGVRPDIVFERVSVLMRREKIGRTGVFLKYSLKEDESFESALRNLSRKNVLVRRLIEERKR